VGGLPVSELNALELEFLRLNNYNLFVTIEELQKYGDNILYHWNHTQNLETLAVKDVSIHTTNEEIAKPFSRLTIKNKGCTTTADNNLDKHWKYNNSNNGRQSFLKPNGNNDKSTTTTTTEPFA
jgi:hypothetical protein